MLLAIFESQRVENRSGEADGRLSSRLHRTFCFCFYYHSDALSFLVRMMFSLNRASYIGWPVFKREGSLQGQIPAQHCQNGKPQILSWERPTVKSPIEAGSDTVKTFRKMAIVRRDIRRRKHLDAYHMLQGLKSWLLFFYVSSLRSRSHFQVNSKLISYRKKRRHELISDKLYRELFITIDCWFQIESSHNFKMSVCWATTRSELASFLLRWWPDCEMIELRSASSNGSFRPMRQW